MQRTARGIRTREAILAAAGELFPKQGYSKTTVRDIAAAAGVDPALVIRHFGSKDALFMEVMDSVRDEVIAFDGDVSRLGERMVRYILNPDAGTRQTFLTLIGASGAENPGASLHAMHELGFVQPLVKTIGGPDAELRARLIASLIGGLMYSLWAAGDTVLEGTPADEVVSLYAPLVQSLCDGPAGSG